MERLQSIRQTIPNAITLSSLAAGFAALVLATRGDFTTAALLVLLATVFDFLDGFAARLLRAQSELGKQLDSLSDLVAFGVAPAFILHRLVADTLQPDVWTTYVALASCWLVPVFSALRLARFNIDPRQAEHFIGLPTPACALLITSIPLMVAGAGGAALSAVVLHPLAVFALNTAAAALLVAPLPLMGLKFKRGEPLAAYKWQFVLLITACVLGVVWGFAAVPLILLAYLVLSFVHFRYKV